MVHSTTEVYIPLKFMFHLWFNQPPL